MGKGQRIVLDECVQGVLEPQKYHSGYVRYHPEALLQRSDLGLDIGRVIAESARVDFWELLIVGRLAGAKARTMRQSVDREFDSHIATADVAIGMFSVLSGKLSKDNTLRSLAKSTLSRDALSSFRRLQKRHEQLSKWRNLIAHGMWGIDENMADALIVQGKLGAAHVALSRDSADEFQHVDTWIYRKETFQSLIRELQNLNSALAAFRVR